MPRKPNIIPSVPLSLMLPMDIRAKVDAILYSDLEQRVPHGAYQKFFLELIRGFFETKELDMSPYLGTPPGVYIIRGRPYIIDELRRKLQAHQSAI